MKSNLNCVSIEILEALEPKIKEMLYHADLWNSLDVDYLPPRVERLWCEIDGYRVFLHTIHQTEEPCLFHKHKWPAAFKQVYGSYEMGITYSDSEMSSEEAYGLPVLSKFIISAGSYYEMTQTDCLHYVRPVGDISCSIMITKDLYPDDRKESLDKILLPLSDIRKKVILDFYKNIL